MSHLARPSFLRLPSAATLAQAVTMLAIGAAFTGDTPVAAGASRAAVRDGAPSPVWTEIKWPFLMDQWGLGRAYACPASACGTPLHIYVRPKVGFCDCTRGVGDDDEVDRVADVELIGANYTALEPSRAVTVGTIAGRSRRYTVTTAQFGRPVMTIAFAENCNVVVATVAGDSTLTNWATDAALLFLNSATMVKWARSEMGS
jgi:hypothetical protein